MAVTTISLNITVLNAPLFLIGLTVPIMPTINTESLRRNDMKKIKITRQAYYNCLSVCAENCCLSEIFFENLANLLEDDEVILSVKNNQFFTNQDRIIELNEII
jgi:hypothetical protein